MKDTILHYLRPSYSWHNHETNILGYKWESNNFSIEFCLGLDPEEISIEMIRHYPRESITFWDTARVWEKFKSSGILTVAEVERMFNEQLDKDQR